MGGRLQQSNLPKDGVHPIILSVKSHFTVLMVAFAHRLSLHVGAATVMATFSASYYIPGVQRLLKKISRRCVICQRARAHTCHQLMGELPADRVRPARPFSIVGVDFAGPFLLKQGNPRKPVIVKSYVCVFVCFACKAVHLELVADLSTDAFVAFLIRFAARHGYPRAVYSDNGTNSVGAQAELQHLYDLLQQDDTKQSILQCADVKEIDWHFSPSRAPHFGVLLEAAVRAMKSVLTKVMGEHKLSYDELTTVLTSAEVFFNSLPVCSYETPHP